MIHRRHPRILARTAAAVLCAAAFSAVPAMADEPVRPAVEAQPVKPIADSNTVPLPFFADTHTFTLLPTSLLWTPALANNAEPRSYVKIMSLETDGNSTNDTEIGGTLPLMRFSAADTPQQGLQVDMFALVMTRFVDLRHQETVDYRFGVPFSYAHGPWSFKLGYEHTSCHLGDELQKFGEVPRPKKANRDDVMFGIAYRPIESLRLYGTFGYAFHLSTFSEDDSPERFSVGAEWTHPGPSGVWGKPYAAVEVECRGDEGYTPNLTAQLGWRWAGDTGRPSERIALEFYDGRSPYGQFIDRHESWVSLGFYFDF